jgi:AcrR family transcriptional regulator
MTVAQYADTDAASSKGERTRCQILEAATRLFAERGYEGTGIRDIETAAGVNRGVVTYHFGNKEDVWKATFTHAFMPYLDELRSKSDLLRALDPKTRARFLIESFVRTSAERPYMNQLMMHENFTESWRSEWIIKNFLEPFRELSLSIAKDDPILQLFETDPHVRYAILGACNMVFSHRCEVNSLFNQDVRDPAFIDRHVATVLDLVEGFLERAAARKEQ